MQFDIRKLDQGCHHFFASKYCNDNMEAALGLGYILEEVYKRDKQEQFIYDFEKNYQSLMVDIDTLQQSFENLFSEFIEDRVKLDAFRFFLSCVKKNRKQKEFFNEFVTHYCLIMSQIEDGYVDNGQKAIYLTIVNTCLSYNSFIHWRDDKKISLQEVVVSAVAVQVPQMVVNLEDNIFKFERQGKQLLVKDLELEFCKENPDIVIEDQYLKRLSDEIFQNKKVVEDSYESIMIEQKCTVWEFNNFLSNCIQGKEYIFTYAYRDLVNDNIFSQNFKVPVILGVDDGKLLTVALTLSFLGKNFLNIGNILPTDVLPINMIEMEGLNVIGKSSMFLRRQFKQRTDIDALLMDPLWMTSDLYSKFEGWEPYYTGYSLAPFIVKKASEEPWLVDYQKFMKGLRIIKYYAKLFGLCLRSGLESQVAVGYLFSYFRGMDLWIIDILKKNLYFWSKDRKQINVFSLNELDLNLNKKIYGTELELVRYQIRND